MRRWMIGVAVASLAASGAGESSAGKTEQASNSGASHPIMTKQNQAGKNWKIFQISDLIAERQRSDDEYLEFLKVPTLSAGLYVLPAEGIDHQEPHDEDEIYYVLSGRGLIRIGTEDRSVEPGSVVFVKAGLAHRFQKITEELRLLVFFSSAKPSQR